MQHSKGQLDHLGDKAVGMAGRDEVDRGADYCFARLNGCWIDVGGVEGVEQACVPVQTSDLRRKAM